MLAILYSNTIRPCRASLRFGLGGFRGKQIARSLFCKGESNKIGTFVIKNEIPQKLHQENTLYLSKCLDISHTLNKILENFTKNSILMNSFQSIVYFRFPFFRSFSSKIKTYTKK